MRTRDLTSWLTSWLTAGAFALAACASNPDPRLRSVETVQRDGHGGWIVVHVTGGAEVHGELIAVDPGAVRVLSGTQLITVAKPQVAAARVWAWQTEELGVGIWGLFGGASTVSHGYFLLVSFPVWVVTTAVTMAVESRASQLDYPGERWDRLRIWARFPQGLPAGVRDSDLIQDRRPRAVPPAGVMGPPGAMAPGQVQPTAPTGPSGPPGEARSSGPAPGPATAPGSGAASPSVGPPPTPAPE